MCIKIYSKNYSRNINFFSVQASAYAQTSLKRTSPDFDPVTPLKHILPEAFPVVLMQ